MTAPSNPARHEYSKRAGPGPGPLRGYARVAGVMLVLSIAAGGLGEMYVPSRLLVSTSAAATAANLIQSATLFRIGFASYLVEALCDVGLAWAFYVLLRPVHRDMALLAAFFGLVATALFGIAEVFYFSSSMILGNAAYLTSLPLEERNTLATLFLKIYGVGGGLFMAFYGVAWLIRGYLIYRSRYMPGLLGILLAIGGLGFVVRNFLMVLAPRYASNFLLLPMFLAVVFLIAWLFARGIDDRGWQESGAILG